MNWISARSSRAPHPVNSRKPEPAILGARSKSSSPSASRSPSGAAARSRTSRGSPQVRTTWFCAASRPGGTEACGRFGIHAASASLSSSSFLSSASSALMRSPTSRIARDLARRPFSPALLLRAISSLAALRRALSCSVSWSSCEPALLDARRSARGRPACPSGRRRLPPARDSGAGT